MRRACGASAWRGGAGSTRSRFWLGFPGASSRADRILRDFSARHQGGPVDAGSLPGGARCQRTRGRSRARGARGAGPPYRPLPPARSRPRPRRCRLSLACRLPAGRRPAAAYTSRRSAAAGPGSGRSRLVRLRRPGSASWLPTTYGVSRATYLPAAPRRAAGPPARSAPTPASLSAPPSPARLLRCSGDGGSRELCEARAASRSSRSSRAEAGEAEPPRRPESEPTWSRRRQRSRECSSLWPPAPHPLCSGLPLQLSRCSANWGLDSGNLSCNHAAHRSGPA